MTNPAPLDELFTREVNRGNRASMVAHGLDVARAELRGDTIVDTHGGFHDYIRRRNPTLLNYEHVPMLADVGERVVQGKLQHVLIIQPPRYFKSEVFSRLLTSYFLRARPDLHTCIISYSAELAWELSSESRDYYQLDGGTLRYDTAAKKRWRTEEGGELWAAGVGGPMLGFGFDLAIIDDPTDPEKAVSPAYQRRFREWFPNKFLSRRNRRGKPRIVLVMQRLGVDDPVDFLFRREVGENAQHAPMNWHVVFMDEVKSDEPIGRWDGPRGLPPTCTVEPDPRPLGTVLAPSLLAKPDVLAWQRESGPWTTATQNQGRPLAPKGDFWKKEWFEGRIYRELPPDAHNGGWDWDTAYTKDEANAASAGIYSYRGVGEDTEFPIYIDDVWWDWYEFPALIEQIKAAGGPHYIEAKATGKSAKQALAKEGINAHEVPVEGDKFARAAAVQAVVANKRVWLSEEVYEGLLGGERQGLLRITAERLISGGPDIDVNDAFVQALHRHTGGRRRQRLKGPRIASITQPATPLAAEDTGMGERPTQIRVGFL